MRFWLVIVLATLCLALVGACPAGAQSPAGSAATAPRPLARADLPVWRVGDEWTYRWESPRGKGTFTRVVEREEVVDGIADYVTVTGARETYWQKADLGFHLTRLQGKLEERAIPPTRIYAWPLTAGKSWEYTYTRERPLDRQSEEFTIAVTVEREEAVTVAAGTFQTFKLVHRNTRTETVVGEWWYAPAVKSFVRQRVRELNVGWVERELVAFKFAGGVAAPGPPTPSTTAPAASRPTAPKPPASPSASPPPAAPASAATPAPPGGARAEFAHKVIYRITGTAPEASITYRNAKGGTQQTGGRLPWEVTFDSRAGNFLYVSAQNQGASGSVSCDIVVDGAVKTTATSTGAYVIAECSEANEP